MKKQRLQQFLAVFLASIVLLSSVGVAVSSHFCHTEGTVAVSVFSKAVCSQEHAAPVSCCAASVAKCCSTPSFSPLAADNNCCTHTEKYLHIDENWLPAKFQKETELYAPLLLFFLPTSVTAFSFDLSPQYRAVERANWLPNLHFPPLPYGRQLLHLIQSYLH